MTVSQNNKYKLKQSTYIKINVHVYINTMEEANTVEAYRSTSKSRNKLFSYS